MERETVSRAQYDPGSRMFGYTSQFNSERRSEFTPTDRHTTILPRGGRLQRRQSTHISSFEDQYAILDRETGYHHFVASGPSKTMHYLLRLIPNGISYVPLPPIEVLEKMDDVDHLLEEAHLHRWINCTRHEYNASDRRVDCEFGGFERCTFYTPQAQEIGQLIDQFMEKWKDMSPSKLRKKKKVPKKRRKLTFEEKCMEFDEYVHRHHMLERAHVNCGQIEDILGSHLQYHVHESHKREKSFTAVTALFCALFLYIPAAVVGIIGAVMHAEEIRHFKMEIRRRFVNATKHGYLYFLSGAPHNYIMYFKGGHFGFVGTATAKEGEPDEGFLEKNRYAPPPSDILK